MSEEQVQGQEQVVAQDQTQPQAITITPANVASLLNTIITIDEEFQPVIVEILTATNNPVLVKIAGALPQLLPFLQKLASLLNPTPAT